MVLSIVCLCSLESAIGQTRRVHVRRPVSAQPSPVYRQLSQQQKRRIAVAPRRTPTTTDNYRIDDGDTLGIIVDGVLGKFGEDVPVHMPKSSDNETQPGIGYPVLVRDGAADLPIVGTVTIRGLTVRQTQTAISNAYIRAKILKKKNHVFVTMLRKRRVNVTVIHEEPTPINFNGQPTLYQSPRKKVTTVSLPADRAGLLDALSEAVVDLDSRQVEQIVRRYRDSRSRPLRDGQVVNVEAPDQGFFYTNGVMPAGQFPIPRDRGLSALQAVAMAGGNFQSHRGGAFLGPSDLVITRQNGQTFRTDFQQLQANPRSVRIFPGDTLTLQYKPREVLGNVSANFLRGAGPRLILGR